MSISTRPPSPPASKKRGLGCLGCGCLLLALLALLFFGVIGLACYGVYASAMAMSSTTPTPIPGYTGTDDLYQSARQKLADFDHDVVNHQAATVRFSADELNALLAQNPDVIRNHIQAYVSFTDTEARVQATLPTDAISHGLMPGRYTSFDVSFEVHFDQVTKTVNLIPHALKIEDKPIVGPEADNPQAAQSMMRAFSPFLNQQLNEGIRKSPDGAALLDQAKSIEVQGGQLVLETR